MLSPGQVSLIEFHEVTGLLSFPLGEETSLSGLNPRFVIWELRIIFLLSVMNGMHVSGLKPG